MKGEIHHFKNKYTIKCIVCGTERTGVMPWTKYCSIACKTAYYRIKHSERAKILQRKSEHDRYHNNKEYRRKHDVRARTKYHYENTEICSLCGAKGKTEFHHIEGYSVDKFIELCRKCHFKAHNRRYRE